MNQRFGVRGFLSFLTSAFEKEGRKKEKYRKCEMGLPPEPRTGRSCIEKTAYAFLCAVLEPTAREAEVATDRSSTGSAGRRRATETGIWVLFWLDRAEVKTPPGHRRGAEPVGGGIPMPRRGHEATVCSHRRRAGRGPDPAGGASDEETGTPVRDRRWRPVPGQKTAPAI
jgi:hypothetical protein